MIYEQLRSRWLDSPHEVSIETLARCNAACTFCPYPTLDRKGERMGDELLEKLVRELIEMKRPLFFTPFKVNEPLLDHRVIPICERLNREAPHIRIRLFTNGTPLTPSNIEALGRLTNIEHLWVSLNSCDPDEYERLMGLKFDLVAKRLDYLHGSAFPHPVVLSTVGWPNDPFREACNKRWPRFASFVMKKDAWIDYTSPDFPDVRDEPCIRWFGLSIMADGKVSLCCMDGTGEFAIGDVNKQTMLEVYNSPHWRERREKLLSRRHVQHPCNGCSY